MNTALLCECGCGEPHSFYNAVVGLAYERLPHYIIADRLGVTRSYVSHILRSPPRFKVGHYRNPPAKDTACPGCGRVFRQMGPGQTYCANSDCQMIKWFMLRDMYEFAARTYKRRQDELARAKLHQVRRMDAKEHSADQDSISKWRDISLFKAVGPRQDGGLLLYQTLADPIYCDPAEVFERDTRASDIRSIIGDLDIADIAMLSSEDLQHIRDSLADAGLTPRGVVREPIRQVQTKRRRAIEMAHAYQSSQEHERVEARKDFDPRDMAAARTHRVKKDNTKKVAEQDKLVQELMYQTKFNRSISGRHPTHWKNGRGHKQEDGVWGGGIPQRIRQALAQAAVR